MYYLSQIAMSLKKYKFLLVKVRSQRDKIKFLSPIKAKLMMQAATVQTSHVRSPKISAKKVSARSVVANILVDDSMSMCGERAGAMAKKLRQLAVEDGVAIARRTFGISAPSNGFASSAIAACKSMWHDHYRDAGKITNESVAREILRISCRLEDSHVLVIITSGAGSELEISNEVYESARQLGVEILLVCLDSAGKRSAILKRRGLQIHFSETPDYSDEVILNLLRRGIMD